jgi:hypothetical protein
VDVSTRRQSRRQTHLPRIEKSGVHLDYDDDGDDDANDDDGDLARPLLWEDRLNELANYRKIHSSENIQLAKWVVTQRRYYRLHRQGKTSPMTPYRFQALESLGFELGSHVAAWKDRLSELADYRKIHGHCNVTKRYSEKSQLGQWVVKQRRRYNEHVKGKPSSMTTFQIQALESLGIEWDSRSAAWEDRLSELADFRRIHGHCNVPYNCSKHTKLSRWVISQRAIYKLHRQGNTSPMPTYRIQALERLQLPGNGTIQ